MLLDSEVDPGVDSIKRQNHSDHGMPQHVYIENGRATVCGIPTDKHDCDVMGCSSLEHVLARVPYSLPDVETGTK